MCSRMPLNKRPLIIGVTGSLSTGKTTVSRMLKELGAYVINADKIVHGLIGRKARAKIGGFVFDDKKSLDKLCGLIHPIVKKEILRKIKENKTKRLIVVDAPLLIESGFHKKCDYLIVVKSGLKKQLKRSENGLGLSRAESLKRIKLQMPLKEKTRLADFIIDNNGSLQQTRKQVEEVFKDIAAGGKGILPHVPGLTSGISKLPRRISIWKK